MAVVKNTADTDTNSENAASGSSNPFAARDPNRPLPGAEVSKHAAAPEAAPVVARSVDSLTHARETKSDKEKPAPSKMTRFGKWLEASVAKLESIVAPTPDADAKKPEDQMQEQLLAKGKDKDKDESPEKEKPLSEMAHHKLHEALGEGVALARQNVLLDTQAVLEVQLQNLPLEQKGKNVGPSIPNMA